MNEKLFAYKKLTANFSKEKRQIIIIKKFSNQKLLNKNIIREKNNFLSNSKKLKIAKFLAKTIV